MLTMMVLRSSLFRHAAAFIDHLRLTESSIVTHFSAIRPLSQSTRTRESKKNIATVEGASSTQVYRTEKRNNEGWERRWQERFESMKAYVERVRREQKLSPDQHIPCPYSDPPLARWLNRNRRHYQLKMQGHETTLTNERQKKLESLGFSLWPRQDFWDTRYKQVCRFVEEKGCFPYDFDEEELNREEILLLHWCLRQRKDYRIYKRNGLRDFKAMTPEREEKLNAINFCWNEHDENWMMRYQELKEYHDHHGHCLVPTEYAANPKLAIWVGEQRTHYRRFQKGRQSSMTTKRFQLLSALDFAWDAVEAIWLRRYNELKEHVQLNGLGSIPSCKQDGSLRSWCKYQQNQFQKYLDGENTSMTKQRKQLLDELGFPW